MDQQLRRFSPAAAPGSPDRWGRRRSRLSTIPASRSRRAETSARRGKSGLLDHTRARAIRARSGSTAVPAARKSAARSPLRRRSRHRAAARSLEPPRAGASSYSHPRASPLEGQIRVVEVVWRTRNVEDERSEAALEIEAQFLRDAVVASNQIGTKGLVVLKRPQPVGVGHSRVAVVARRQLLVP